ncbi:hypothetical protein HCA60_02855 [Listeria booriae]|uniref:hypothetical protein n=1 Tax=Listeria booriae TaxID=1552123 RepID=UPI001625E95E|nr:hypothetical protein [Listeria booriae]MBC1811429.1 hypothetical protein [Listeria booriae]
MFFTKEKNQKDTMENNILNFMESITPEEGGNLLLAMRSLEYLKTCRHVKSIDKEFDKALIDACTMPDNTNGLVSEIKRALIN